MSTKDNDLLGWSPMDAASRATQAFFGLGLFLLSSGNNDELINNFAKDTLSSLEIVGTRSDSENIQTYLGLRDMFYEMLGNASFDLFSKENERIWQVFMERFDLRTCQLRMNLIDMHECVNISVLARSMNREEKYLYQLPLSAEIVVIYAKRGIHIEIYIPSRLLILDMLVMLLHTRAEHQKLETAANNRSEQLMIELKRDGLLDTYARQVLILATTVCDNILTEYGSLVEELLKQEKSEDLLDEIININKLGVTQRLKKVPAAWSHALKKNITIDSKLIDDMATLVQIRNRLVHPDGRVNCWHAFQLSPLTGDGWQFTERIQPYLNRSNYGVTDSYIGYEFALARFCVDTTLHMVHLLHFIIFDTQTPWLEFAPPNFEGELDLDKVAQTELSFWRN